MIDQHISDYGITLDDLKEVVKQLEENKDSTNASRLHIYGVLKNDKTCPRFTFKKDSEYGWILCHITEESGFGKVEYSIQATIKDLVETPVIKATLTAIKSDIAKL